MPKKKFFEKWQTWVTFLVALLTLIGLMIDLPQKIIPLFKSEKPDAKIRQVLAGEIVDEEGNPLPDVIVQLPEFDVLARTDSFGKFKLEVLAPKQARVAFRARKEGFEIVNLDPYLGDRFLNFKMKRK